jgi:hypothetical protein
MMRQKNIYVRKIFFMTKINKLANTHHFFDIFRYLLILKINSGPILQITSSSYITPAPKHQQHFINLYIYIYIEQQQKYTSYILLVWFNLN